MDQLLPMLLATALPAGVAFGLALLLPRLWRAADQRPVALLWLVAALGATIAIPLHGGFPTTGSAAPLQLPGGIAWLLPALACLPPLARLRGRDAGAAAILASAAFAALLLAALSFPWWSRPVAGSAVLAASALGAALLVLGLEAGARGGHRTSTIAWAATAAACAPFLIQLAAITHAQVLAVALAPVAAAALAGFLGGTRLFAPRGAVLPAVVVAALVANAAVRYVPGSDDDPLAVWALRLSPLALVLGPWACAGLRRLFAGRVGAILGALAWAAILAAGVGASRWGYTAGADADGGGSGYDASDYGSIDWDSVGGGE